MMVAGTSVLEPPSSQFPQSESVGLPQAALIARPGLFWTLET
eukprot:CAMPEP_0170618354 /NCGR_PEP_ID=MMETSP0224-20130122/26913_1 /TAXON_ID=285029 /ORGANISM="Togula jolla, Strain CCCM 725" /LENGTH=41 /DNA_ID= /DNA_START= /DNA_END= /DNA_ORIENTATION=